MNLRPLDGLAWLLSLAVGVGFILPWIKMPLGKELPRPRVAAIVKELTSDSSRQIWEQYFLIKPEEWQRALQTNGMNVTGLEIGWDFYRSHHRLEAATVSASGLLGSERQADRAIFVFAFPVLGFLSAAFISWVSRKWALLLPLAASGGLYGFTRYQINETALQRLALSIDIGIGLWMALYALLALCLILVLRLLLPIQTRL